jgi:RNA polymerase sigma-70 factor, ECF subfamily
MSRVVFIAEGSRGVSDENAWRQLIESNGPALVLFARQHARSLDEAEDAVQEGLLRAWQKRSAVNDLRAYAFACVRSAALDQSRSQQRRERREDRTRAGATDAHWLTAPSEQQETRARLETALRQLSGEQREVVVMKIWGELSFAQIGAALDVPLNTAASRYRYALERLRELLGGEDRP